MKANPSAASLRISTAVLLILALCLGTAFPGCRHAASVSLPPSPSLPALPADPPSGLFADVTTRAGITFRHTNGDPVRYLFLQSMGGGCAFLDYDQDGYPDILLLSCGEWPDTQQGERQKAK